MKTGLVLEGGAMRGMYTAGVLDVFLRNKTEFQGIVGVSAGALFGVNFLSEQEGRAIRYNKRFIRDKNYLGLRHLIREGNLFCTDYAYGKVPRELDVFDDETFKKSPVPFYAVATDIESGQGEYIQIKTCFEQMDALRASGSMPFVSRPVEIEGRLYLDGGITDSIPFEWMSKQGYDRLVVILTRDMSYRKKSMSKGAIKLCYRKYPKLREKLLTRHEAYNSSVEKLTELEKEGKVFVIRPSAPIEIGRLEKDPQKLQEVYDLGVRDGENIMPKLSEYLGKSQIIS